MKAEIEVPALYFALLFWLANNRWVNLRPILLTYGLFEPQGTTISSACVDGVRDYCSFAYSALACFRMGMSGSASFQRLKKS